MIRLEGALFSGLLLFLVSVAALPAQEKKTPTLQVAYGALSPSRFPYMAAKQARLYEKYGLTANLLFISGAPTALNALLGGDVHMVATSGVAAVSLGNAGAPVVIIAGIGTTPYRLVARSEIASLQDLKGKIVGTDRIGGVTDFALKDLLPKLGMIPGQDVKLLPTGLTNPEQRMLLIRQGKIDATLSVPDDILRMARQGFKVNILADLVERGVYTSGGDLITSQQFLRENRSVALAFLKALTEAIWLGKKNKDFALKVYRNYLKTDDAEILEVLYQTYVLGVIKPKPSPNTEGLQKSIDFIANTNPRLRGVNAANFIDDSLIGELEQEGFFTRLYR
jgi:ABC-type nitrate/sulfonate/bicarbonate transport system substrate-binding protein